MFVVSLWHKGQVGGGPLAIPLELVRSQNSPARQAETTKRADVDKDIQT